MSGFAAANDGREPARDHRVGHDLGGARGADGGGALSVRRSRPRKVRGGADQDQPLDPLGRVDRQPLADHAADRQSAVRTRARFPAGPAARARRAPGRPISYGPSGTGERPWPRWSKRTIRTESASSSTCGSHISSVVPSEPPSSSDGAVRRAVDPVCQVHHAAQFSPSPASRLVSARCAASARSISSSAPSRCSLGRGRLAHPGGGQPLEVLGHPLRIDLEMLEQLARPRRGRPDQPQQLGVDPPLGLPGAGRALVLLLHRGQHGRHQPRHALGAGQHRHRRHRVALVRHGARAAAARSPPSLASPTSCWASSVHVARHLAEHPGQRSRARRPAPRAARGSCATAAPARPARARRPRARPPPGRGRPPGRPSAPPAPDAGSRAAACGRCRCPSVQPAARSPKDTGSACCSSVRPTIGVSCGARRPAAPPRRRRRRRPRAAGPSARWASSISAVSSDVLAGGAERGRARAPAPAPRPGARPPAGPPAWRARPPAAPIAARSKRSGTHAAAICVSRLRPGSAPRPRRPAPAPPRRRASPAARRRRSSSRRRRAAPVDAAEQPPAQMAKKTVSPGPWRRMSKR